MLRTQWDPFEDLRSAQDELHQLNPMLAHALGLHRQQQGVAASSTPLSIVASICSAWTWAGRVIARRKAP